MADEEENSETNLAQEDLDADEDVPTLPSISKSKSAVKQNKSSKILGFVAPAANPVEAPPSVSAFERVTSQLQNYIKSKTVVSTNVDAASQATTGATLLERRSPFSHNPPRTEERRDRISNPRSVRDYIFNFREDLADFQATHGLPRTRDYSFLSLTWALGYETLHALYAVFIMIMELFPVLAIISLILRFILDKVRQIFSKKKMNLKMIEIFILSAS